MSLKSTAREGASRSLATAGLERTRKQRDVVRGEVKPASITGGGCVGLKGFHLGDSTIVSHVRQGLVEERNFLKFGESEREREEK